MLFIIYYISFFFGTSMYLHLPKTNQKSNLSYSRNLWVQFYNRYQEYTWFRIGCPILLELLQLNHPNARLLSCFSSAGNSAWRWGSEWKEWHPKTRHNQAIQLELSQSLQLTTLIIQAPPVGCYPALSPPGSRRFVGDSQAISWTPGSACYLVVTYCDSNFQSFYIIISEYFWSYVNSFWFVKWSKSHSTKTNSQVLLIQFPQWLPSMYLNMVHPSLSIPKFTRSCLESWISKSDIHHVSCRLLPIPQLLPKVANCCRIPMLSFLSSWVPQRNAWTFKNQPSQLECFRGTESHANNWSAKRAAWFYQSSFCRNVQGNLTHPTNPCQSPFFNHYCLFDHLSTSICQSIHQSLIVSNLK